MTAVTCGLDSTGRQTLKQRKKYCLMLQDKRKTPKIYNLSTYRLKAENATFSGSWLAFFKHQSMSHRHLQSQSLATKKKKDSQKFKQTQKKSFHLVLILCYQIY